jgi:hypothetical protein
MSRFTARFDADLAVVARPVAQRVHEEIGHDAPEQDAVTLNHGQISGDDAGTTSTDFTVEQLDAVTYKPLEAHRCALERLAMRAGLKEEGFDQEAHARHRAKQAVDVAARIEIGPNLQVFGDHPCVCLGNDERLHQLVGRHAGEHLDRGKFALQLGQARPLIGSIGSRPLRFVVAREARRPRRTLSFLNFSTMRLLHVFPRGLPLHDALAARLPSWTTLAGGSHAPGGWVMRMTHTGDGGPNPPPAAAASDGTLGERSITTVTATAANARRALAERARAGLAGSRADRFEFTSDR